MDIYPKILFHKFNFLSPEVTWPNRQLPKSFILENHLYKAWCYLVDYDGLDINRLVDLLFKNKETQLVELSSDFLIILLDKTNQSIKTITSLSGQFPLFFYITPNTLTISPSFYEVFQTVENPLINLDETMDYLISEYNLYQTDQTFIQQINRLPPGCLLEVKSDLRYHIKELFSWEKILENIDNNPLSNEEFAEQLIEELDKNIKKRLKNHRDIKIVADLSSGMDSPLVVYLLSKNITSLLQCYSHYVSWNQDDTDPDIVKKFAAKHNLQVHFIETSNFLAISEGEDINWNQTHFFPGTHSQALELNYHKQITTDMGSPVFDFTGHGGDEFFNSLGIHEYAKNEKDEMIDFINLNVKSGAENIFTPKGLELLTDKDRLQNKKLYSNQIGSESVGWLNFPVVWNSNSWLVKPFADISMIKLGQKIPRIDKDPIHKQKILKHRLDIFPPEQFRTKTPFDRVVKTFFEKKKHLILQILENSLLEDLEIIKVPKIKKALLENNGEKYVDQLFILFINFLKLEVFFQANNVKI